MNGLNKVQIIGNLGSEPEIRNYNDNGGVVANFSVATNAGWKDNKGQKVEKTEWHKIVAFDGLGKIVSDYLTKGSQVYIEGRLQTRKWKDKSGADRYTTEIVAGELIMLGGARKEKPAETPTAAVPDVSKEDLLKLLATMVADKKSESEGDMFAQPGDDIAI